MFLISIIIGKYLLLVLLTLNGNVLGYDDLGSITKDEAFLPELSSDILKEGTLTDEIGSGDDDISNQCSIESLMKVEIGNNSDKTLLSYLGQVIVQETQITLMKNNLRIKDEQNVILEEINVNLKDTMTSKEQEIIELKTEMKKQSMYISKLENLNDQNDNESLNLKDLLQLEKEGHLQTNIMLSNAHLLSKFSKKLIINQENQLLMYKNVTKMQEQLLDEFEQKDKISRLKIMQKNDELTKKTELIHLQHHGINALKHSVAKEAVTLKAKNRLIRILQTALSSVTTELPSCSSSMVTALEKKSREQEMVISPQRIIIDSLKEFKNTSIYMEEGIKEISTILVNQLLNKDQEVSVYFNVSSTLHRILDEKINQVKSQSESIETLKEELNHFLGDRESFRVRRDANGNLIEATTCQCLPEPPKQSNSNLLLEYVHFSCDNNTAINNNTAIWKVECKDGKCEENSWPTCHQRLKTPWSEWNYTCGGCTEPFWNGICLAMPCLNQGSNGKKTRTRSVRNSTEEAWSDEMEERECSKCPIKVLSTEWTPWSSCSATCGAGIRNRYKHARFKTYNELERETDSQRCISNCEERTEWSQWFTERGRKKRVRFVRSGSSTTFDREYDTDYNNNRWQIIGR